MTGTALSGRCVALLFSGAVCIAQTYTALDLGYLGAPQAYYSQAFGINNLGQVAGRSQTVNGIYPFIYSGGTMTALNTPFQPTYTIATAINYSGQAVGWGLSLTGWLYTAGSTFGLGDLGDGYTYPLAINSSGTIVGWSANSSGLGQAFTCCSAGGTSLTPLAPTPAAPTDGGPFIIATSANGINDSGQIAGGIDNVTGGVGVWHAALWSGGVVTDLGTLGGTNSCANAVNNNGQVVGYSETASGAIHAFLYNGQMIDLGTIGGRYSYATAINNSGQIVGFLMASGTAFGGCLGNGATNEVNGAFLYSGGSMVDLDTLVTNLATCCHLSDAEGINDYGQIAANGGTAQPDGSGAAYLLTPSGVVTRYMSVVNPFVSYATNYQAPPAITTQAIASAAPASSLAADGVSAVVVVYRSTSSNAVTFALSNASGLPNSNGPLGSLAAFDPNYLVSPSAPSGYPQSYQAAPAYGPDSQGNYVFLALLWSPNGMPGTEVPLVTLAVTATQAGLQGAPAQVSIALKPPPLLLVHGIWSSAKDAGFLPGTNGFYDWLTARYPHNFIYPVNYGFIEDSVNLSSQSFSDPRIQAVVLKDMSFALRQAALGGMAARTVDVAGHSMGGLATRYFLGPSKGYTGNPALLPNPVHQLITIGTPHLGSPLATELWTHRNDTPILLGPVPGPSTMMFASCSLISIASNACTLSSLLAANHKQVDTGVQSLEPGSGPLDLLGGTYNAIIGVAPTSSTTRAWMNTLIGIYLQNTSVDSVIGEANDVIVGVSSQTATPVMSATIDNIVHTAVCPGGACDVGETASPTVWAQAYDWLTTGANVSPGVAGPLSSSSSVSPSTSNPPAAVFDLTGYTQVAASNVTFQPASGSTLTINSPVNIAAASAKTITEIVLLQAIADPNDEPIYAVTQAPFSVPFTPARLGSTAFAAFTLFSDKTFSMTTLNYTFQPSGSPTALNLADGPGVLLLPMGDSIVLEADAVYGNGSVNVTSAATYTVRKGSTSVLSAGANGKITAQGSGLGLVDVSYGGIVTTAQILVGGCAYSLGPSNQIVPVGGGSVSIQVTATSGCSWTATGGASWLTLQNSTGSGNGAIALTASANTTGQVQAATVALDGQSAIVTQPAAACTYTLSQTQVNALAAGGSGTVTATSSCPVIASSNQSWVTATPLGSTVGFTVAPNVGMAQRSATLTIGTAAVSITQASIAATTAITIQTGPAGLLFTVDGGAQQTAPVTLSLTAGSHTITVTATEAGSAGTQYLFTSWSDGGAASHSITVGSSPASYTATFQTQYQLSIGAAPAAGGTVAPASGFYNAGTVVPIAATANTGYSFSGWTGSVANGASASTTVAMTAPETVTANFSSGTGAPTGLALYPVTPCRVADTRSTAGPFGGPTMTAGSTRSFVIPSSACGIPAGAQAYSLNITVVPAGTLGYLTAWPTGQAQPYVSTLNSSNGAIIANAAIVPAGAGGAISIYVSDATDAIIDINGYFGAPGSAGALAFYPATPCRVADTRSPNGPFGGPSLGAGATRNFAVPSSTCGIPSTAQAYSLNMTVAPPGPLEYLSTWPTGQTQPYVSTLNALQGQIAANAAIVPAGNGGAISVFVSDPSNVIIDINGYFSPPGSPGALYFYPVTPCRVADTRNGTAPLGGPSMGAGATRTFPIPTSTCGLPSTAQAYSFNMTVVPSSQLFYLTTWPAGQTQPVVSTLNDLQGQTVANAAIVPAGASGAIAVFVSDATNVIIDVNGFFGQ